MTDSSKRRTLKWLGATPLAALPFASIAGVADFAVPQGENSLLTVSRTRVLNIQIVDTSNVPDNTVLIHNFGQEKVTIGQFMVGAVIFNSRMLDLNALTSKGPIVIASGQTKSFSADIWNVLAAPAIEHTYADHVVEVLNTETRVIKLGVYMFDDNAVVYTDPVKVVYS